MEASMIRDDQLPSPVKESLSKQKALAAEWAQMQKRQRVWGASLPSSIP